MVIHQLQQLISQSTHIEEVCWTTQNKYFSESKCVSSKL